MAKSAPRITSFDHVLAGDKDSDNKTKFHLRSLSTTQKMEITDAINAGAGSAVYWKLVRYGLLGWENFLDENDKQTAFSESMSENIERLTPAQIIEIGLEILKASSLTDEERKN